MCVYVMMRDIYSRFLHIVDRGREVERERERGREMEVERGREVERERERGREMEVERGREVERER